MPTLSYTQETMPKSSEEFQRQLAEAMAASNPIDDLLELAADLRCFEQKYEMASDEFYRKYKAGVLNEELQHCMEWASFYRMYSKTRRAIENALVRAAVYPEIEPAVSSHEMVIAEQEMVAA
ncbi:MAG: hypothetical protein DWI57_09845 [Chloroflexi bacterium]|nr:MAG: hypothetical protein DWI57_09845 [Chloroflexota bacterium]